MGRYLHLQGGAGGRAKWVALPLSLLALALSLGFGANAAAAAPGMISGKVIGALSQEPIQGIEVCARENSSEIPFGERCSTTTASGEYTITALSSGRYTVEFLSPFESGLNYVTQYYNGRSSPAQADPVTVRAAETTTGIDAEMHEGGRISGHVSDASTGAPVAGFTVCAGPFEARFEEEGPNGGCAITDASGNYTIAALPAGSYAVAFLSFFGELNYVTQYYNGAASFATAQPVNVTVGGTAAGINAALHEGARISGTVTDASTGAGLGGAFVCALNAGAGNAIEACAITDSGGAYTLQALPSGSYKVQFTAGNTYLRQYYNDQYSLAEAQVLPVTAGTLTAGINAAMEHGPRAAPKNTAAPSISGSPAPGASLSCVKGSWTGAPAPRFTYAWLRDGTLIPGASEGSYTVPSGEEGHTIACEVTATNIVGKATAASAGVLIPIPPPPPAPLLSVVSAKLRVSGTSLSVRLKCTRAPCRGSAELTLQVTVKRRRGGRTISHRQTLILAKGSFSLAGGQAGSVRLRLTALGRKRLAHAKRHPLKLKLTLSMTGAGVITQTVVVS